MKSLFLSNIVFLMIFGILFSCAGSDTADNWYRGQDYNTVLFSVDGLDGPEAVRYDSEQDIFFVSCFNGATSGDANGYIARVSSDGEITDTTFMTGTEEFPFDAGRGMFITGDTLWVADHSGVHYFNKFEGDHLGFVDFAAFENGFINDITKGPDGLLYVTDTGMRSLFRIKRDMTPELVQDSLPVVPNGITTLPDGKLAIAPWREGPQVFQYDTKTMEWSEFGMLGETDNVDGIEFFNNALITSAQKDSSLRLMINGLDEVLINLPGRPADIAIDNARGIVAVPYVALNRVDFWKLTKN